MFQEVRARNFMRIKDATLPLADQGLVLILGRNEDAEHAGSNGAGKTSLLDMLTWGVWGQTVRNQKHDAVINRTVGKNCHVTVTLKLGDSDYEINRYRKCDFTDKPNDLTLSMDGEDISGSGMADTQSIIDRLLGLDFPTFQCMMPGAGVKAADMTDTKIKEMLEKLLRTEAMAAAHKLAKDKVKQLRATLEGLILAKDKANCEVAIHAVKQQDYEAKIASADTDRAEALAALTARKDELESKIAKEDKTALAGVEADAAMSALAKASAEPRTAVEKAAILLDKTRKLNDENAATYNQAVYVADRDLASCRKDLANLATHCKSCGQALDGDNYAKVHKRLTTQEAYLVDEASRNAREYREWKEEANKLMASLESDLAVKQAALDSVAEEYSALEKVSEAAAASERILWTYVEAKSQLEADIKAKENEISPYEDLLTEILEKLVTLRAKWAELNASAEDVTVDLTQHLFWVEGFSAKGLRNHMLKSVVPVLNSAAAKYSEIVTGGEMQITFNASKTLGSGETRDEFTIQVVTKDGADSYTGCSAGEKARVDIIIAFALGDLAQKRAKKRIPFRFLDEPFESIDEEGNEAVLRLLQSQEDYNTVYCITHKQSFQQLFNKHLWVVKSGGESKLEQTTP